MSLQSSFRSLSMGRKLRLVLMAVAGVALAVYASLTFIHGLREVEQLNRESLTALLDVTARNLEAPLVFNDGHSAQETLRALAADPGVVEVRVLDREGKLFARYVRGSHEGKGSDTRMDEWLPQGWNRLALARDVTFRNAPMGRVELVATRERYWAAVGRGGLIWAGVTCLALLAASLLARRLQRVLTEPLERLEQAAQDIARRKRFSVRVERGPEDEIGHLIDSFNAMLAEIEHRDLRLKQQRENLEAEVLVRTEELVASRDAAEEATRVKSRFLATMSHEIRTPLNGLLGMMRLLQASPLNAEQARMSEAALRSGETLMHLLNDILDFSKIEAGRLSLDAVPFDLADTVESAVQLLAGNAREKRLELAVMLADNLPATLAGDPNRLKQVLFNLLGNAIKFTDQGEVVLSVTKIAPPPGAPGSYGEGVAQLRFAVRDTGVGIPVADQGKLFHAFNQTDMVGSRRTSGTGLGLSISRELVRLMGGDLTVNSQEGEGAEFVFELPLHVVRDNPTAILYPGCSLLLLEPHDTVARIVSAYARFLGMACRRFSSLEEAAPVLAQGGFDLVLADICYLPQDDAAWQHWQEVSGVPWAALTAFGEALLPPAFAMRLVKPVLRKEFMRLMGQMLRQRSTTASRPASRQVGRQPARPHFSGNVLLVEDNLTNQEVTQGLLQLLGCKVRVAGNGEEALACVAGEDFDLILMDC
ncbi:MAG: HAMP domain-containing protein, partial [Betaproteobacteria bacterium]|nr:HAMP domain-containing protein [Betaproteobacteria bacterium]